MTRCRTFKGLDEHIDGYEHIAVKYVRLIIGSFDFGWLVSPNCS
jgi:hypothetical protein